MISRSLKPVFYAAVLSVGIMNASPALAKATLPAQPAELIDQKVIGDIRQWLANPVVAMSIESQNKRRANMTQKQIDDADQEWVREREAEDQPLVAAVLTNPLSSYLTQIQARSGGLYSEIFVMDDKGLNVGQSSITSDFWQGDENKFQNTYPKGPDAVFIDQAEYNKDSDNWRAQVSMTMTGQDGAKIGAVTVEVNLTELARRKGM
jgi:hypothetical protein